MRLRRRDFLAASLVTGAARSQSRRRPNVLLILTDDQGYGDNSATGNTIVKTPVLEKLAGESVRFTRFYVSPVCAPTRSSLLTGRYHLRTGVWGVTGGRETMRTDEVTVAEALKKAGYRTGLTGKWHLGEHFPHVPHNQGFDEFTGFRLGHWNRYLDPPLERNGKPFAAKGYISDVLTDEAIGFIDRHRSEPFFLYLAYNAPHSPYIVPDRFYDRFEGKGLTVPVASVYAMVENLDGNIGRILSHLEKSGLSQDTIVVFLCDNGPTGGVRFNAGLRAQKASVYEGGVRSPLWVRWQGRLTPKDVDGPAAHIDLYPTLMELCGVPRPPGPPIDGVSLAASMTGSTPVPDRMLFFHNAGNRIRSPYPGAVRNRRWSLVNGKELYDLANDKGEQADVSASHPEVAEKLRAAYQSWFEEAAGQCGFAQPVIPVGYAEENPVVLPATRAKLAGGLKYFGDHGYAHDWATGWSSSGTMEWDVDVVREGAYEAQVLYLSKPEGVGAALTFSAANASTSAKLLVATKNEPLPTGLRQVSPHYLEFPWQTLTVGRLRLAKGSQTLRLTAGGEQAAGVHGIKQILLRKL